MHQGHFGGVAVTRKHAFAEKSAAQRYAVKAADQYSVAPGLHTVGEAHVEQLHDRVFNHRVDPGFRAIVPGFSAQLQNLGEGGVAANLEDAATDGFF